MDSIQKLKTDYPWIQTPLIVGAPMRLIALADLAVAISKAGTYRPSATQAQLYPPYPHIAIINITCSALRAPLMLCRRHRLHWRRNRRLRSRVIL
jgi:hypothetical protein